MDQVVYLDAKAKELEKMLSGEKTMIIRGAAGRKMPYGRVDVQDRLFLIENDGSGLIKASCLVASVINSEKMDPEQSAALVDKNQHALQLTAKQKQRWSGKRYLVIIEVERIEKITPFKIDKSDFGNMDDWLPVGKIDQVRLS